MSWLHLKRRHQWLSSIVVMFALFIEPSSFARAESPVTALAMTPSGDQIIAGSQDKISVRDWPSLANEKTHSIAHFQIHDIQFSPDGSQLLIVGGKPSEQGEWRILAWPDLRVVASSNEHDDVVYSAVWLGQDRFATAAADNQVMEWKLPAQKKTQKPINTNELILRRLTGHSRRVLGVGYIERDSLLISAGVDHSLRVWNLGSSETTPLRVMDNHTGIVRDLAVRPGNHAIPYVASASADKTVRIWQPSIGRLVRFVRLPVEPLSIDWSVDGKQIGVGCVDGKLRIVSAATVRVEQEFDAINGWAYCVLAAPDGSFAVGGSGGKLVRVVIEANSD